MEGGEISDQYFTFEGRLASFQSAQPVSRRKSNAKGRAPKPLAWPHKQLDPTAVSSHVPMFPARNVPVRYGCSWLTLTRTACSSRFLLRTYTRISRQCDMFPMPKTSRRVGGWRRSDRGASTIVGALWMGYCRSHRVGTWRLQYRRP